MNIIRKKIILNELSLVKIDVSFQLLLLINCDMWKVVFLKPNNLLEISTMSWFNLQKIQNY